SSVAHPRLPSFPTRRSSDLVVSDGDVIDIDTHTDLLVAEAVLSTRSPAPAPTPQNRDRKGAGPVQARPLSPTPGRTAPAPPHTRSEEYTSELQSRENLVCRL